MKKNIQSLGLLAALAMFMSVGICLNAQQTTPQTAPPDTTAQPPDAQAQQPPSPATPDQAQPAPTPDQGAKTTPESAPSAQAGDVQSFSGTITKQGDKYVLKDEASGQTYDVDHQDEVQKFDGKRVRVKGTLDATGKMIHLQ